MGLNLKNDTSKSRKSELHDNLIDPKSKTYKIFAEDKLEQELGNFVEDNFEKILEVLQSKKKMTVMRLIDIFSIPKSQLDLVSDRYQKDAFSLPESILIAFILKNSLLKDGCVFFLPFNQYLSKSNFGLYIYALEHDFLEVKEFNVFEALLWHSREVSQEFFDNIEALVTEVGSYRKIADLAVENPELIKLAFYAYSGQRLQKSLSDISPLLANQLGFMTDKPKNDLKRFADQGQSKLKTILTRDNTTLPIKVSSINIPHLERAQKVIQSQWFSPEKYLEDVSLNIMEMLRQKAGSDAALV
jgi:hypothetical protein